MDQDQGNQQEEEQQFAHRFGLIRSRLLGLVDEVNQIREKFPNVQLSGIDLLGPEIQTITVSSGYAGRVLGNECNVRVAQTGYPEVPYEVHLQVDQAPRRWLAGPRESKIKFRPENGQLFIRRGVQQQYVLNTSGQRAIVRPENITPEHMIFYIVDVHQQAENQKFLDQCGPDGMVTQGINHVVAQMPDIIEELRKIDMVYKLKYGFDQSIPVPNDITTLLTETLEAANEIRYVMIHLKEQMPGAITTSYDKKRMI